MKRLLAVGFVIAASATTVLASDWTLYRASIAAAEYALRLNDGAAAASWLEAAPRASRGWEWRHLRARVDNSTWVVRAHDGAITGVTANATDHFVATTSTDRSVRVWNALTGQRIAVLVGAAGTTWSPAWQPGQPKVAAIGSDGQLRVWDLAAAGTPEPAPLAPMATIPTGGRGMGATAWSPDGSLLAASTWTVEPGKGVEGWVHVWRFETRELLWKAHYGQKPIPALAFRADGQQLVVGTWDGWIGFFDVAGPGTPKPDVHIPPVDGRYTAVQHVAYTLDGDVLVGTKDGLARLYRSSDGELRRELRGHTRWVNAVAGPGDLRGVVATASSDETIRVWDLGSARGSRVLLGHRAAITGLASPPGHLLVSGDASGELRGWSLMRGKGEPKWWQLTGNTVYGVAFSADGRHAATASWRGEVALWSIAEQRAVWSRRIHQESANAVAFHPDGTRIVTSGNDGRMIVQRADTGAEVASWDAGGGRPVTSVAWSPDGRTIASPAASPHAALWDATTGERVTTFSATAGSVTAVAFSPDGRLLALASGNGDVRLVDVRSGDTKIAAGAHAGGAQAAAFEPRGRWLATAGADRLIRVWAVPTLRPVRVLRGHAELVYGVTFSPDGTRIASASSDQTVRLWSAATGEPLLQLPFDDQVYGVRFSPDGQTLAVQPMDGTVRLLEAPAYH